MDAAIYTRNARPNQATREAQAEVCKRLADALNYKVVKESHDEGREQPALDQLLATIRDEQISALIVAEFDRLSRSSKEFANIIETLDTAGVPLYVAGHGRVSLPAMPALWVMLASAEYEAGTTEDEVTR